MKNNVLDASYSTIFGREYRKNILFESTTRLKSYLRIRMNLFSKSCFPISWTNTSLLVVPLVSRWYNSLQITKIRLWVVILLELNRKILLLQIMNYNFKGFLKLLFFNPFSNWFGLQGLLALECHIFKDLVPSGDNCQHHVCKRFVLLWFAIHYQMNSFVLEHCMNCCLIG